MDKSSKIIRCISISNFKSLKSVIIEDCRRINVFVGRPNVGKSNILEALALFDVPFLVNSSNKSLRNIVRTENVADLFHNGNYASPISVIADNYRLNIAKNKSNGLNIEIANSDSVMNFNFTSSLAMTTKKEPTWTPDILTYFFPKHFSAELSSTSFLVPPSGGNLMETVAASNDLRANLSEIFHSYGLKMMFDNGSQQIMAMKEDGHDMFLVPFNSLADSLQRLIFYKSAIESNRNKVLCFEEPEAHTFPPYISSIINDVIAGNTNQYFLTTHSPYVVGALLESAGDDLAIYVVDMKDNSTAVNRMSAEQMQSAYDNGIDIFYNMEMYL